MLIPNGMMLFQLVLLQKSRELMIGLMARTLPRRILVLNQDLTGHVKARKVQASLDLDVAFEAEADILVQIEEAATHSPVMVIGTARNAAQVTSNHGTHATNAKSRILLVEALDQVEPTDSLVRAIGTAQNAAPATSNRDTHATNAKSRILLVHRAEPIDNLVRAIGTARNAVRATSNHGTRATNAKSQMLLVEALDLVEATDSLVKAIGIARNAAQATSNHVTHASNVASQKVMQLVIVPAQAAINREPVLAVVATKVREQEAEATTGTAVAMEAHSINLMK
jgi:hypothetical protein